jgi:hypothetical protein
LVFLSPSEQNYLSNNEQFSKAKQRYIRYRLNRKLRLLGEDLTSGGISQDIAAAAAAPRQRSRDGPHMLLSSIGGDNSVHESEKSNKRARWDAAENSDESTARCPVLSLSNLKLEQLTFCQSRI